MSSKTKKKSSAAPEGKKIKLPEAFIVRPGLAGATTVHIQPDIAEALELQKNAFVELRKDGASVVAIVATSADVDSNVICVPPTLRSLGGFLLGDRVTIDKYSRQPPYADLVEVYVEKDAVTDTVTDAVADTDTVTDTVADTVTDTVAVNVTVKKALAAAALVQPGMQLEHAGKRFTVVDAHSLAAQFEALSLDLRPPAPVLLVNQSTKVSVAATKDSLRKYHLPQPFAFDQVGGLARPVALLRAAVQLPLHHAALFLDFGISPPRGILLHGPPGTGKTMLLRCVAHECQAHVLMVNGPLIVSKYLGETETALRAVFAEAVRFQPAIIFMDEIDSLAPKRGLEDAGETESRVVATLLTMMDGMADAGRVVVVGATNRPNAIDPALRRPGRFDQEVEVGIPDAAAREDILVRQLARMRRCRVLRAEIRALAEKTHGYVGADLAAVCREGVMRAIGRALARDQSETTGHQSETTGNGPETESSPETESIPETESSAGPVDNRPIDSVSLASGSHVDTQVEARDLDAALAEVRPSAMREIFLEMPRVAWADIAGQHALKQKLTEVVQLPLSAAPTFARLGISAPKGVLLYGPPGCSKTLAAKALASESGLNFLAVKGPEVFNKYVGESERAVREIFRKARAAAPSIVFLDEIDALACRDESATLAGQNVLTSLLNEIDGVEELQGVVVVAATNRPTDIDPALLRPGRLDRHIYVAPPDREARCELIARRCAKFSVDGADELFARLADATEGCSGAEVALLCQEAGLAAIMEDSACEKVEERHFDHALKGISRGITPDMIEYYTAFAKRSGLSM